MAREMAMPSEEALKYVWGGAIPLQIHLHESEVTTLPPPPPALILGPRIGYLPLLIPLIKPHFESALPPGVDTVWFEYKGLPLKWYIPTGVLFDILCAEPERPWNLTVHFRGYPSELLTPCEGEDSIKWSFINFLKEAAYIINGNCKNVMNMSQADQLELWQSVVKGNMEGYLRVSSRLKLGPVGEDCLLRRTLNLQAGTSEAHSSNQTGRIPVRLYVRYVSKEFELEDATAVATWDNISYINRPVEIHNEEGKNHTLQTAMESLLPNFFHDRPVLDDQTFSIKEEVLEVDAGSEAPETESDKKVGIDGSQTTAHHELNSTDKPQVKLIRIQGFEPGLDLPLAWIVNNLSNPDYFLHVCVYISSDNACHQGNSALI